MIKLFELEIECLKTKMTQYQHLDEIDHILSRPDMYVGSTQCSKRELYIYDFETQKCSSKEVDYNPGLERIFLEPLSNACDNVFRTREKNLDAGVITVKVIDGKISIENQGVPISIYMMEDQKMFSPEFIFSKLRTGSNFDDNEERQLCGRNGFGVKLTNVYSNYFEIVCNDGKQEYSQSWENHMRVRHNHVLKKTSSAPFTRVSFKPDFDYFYRDSELKGNQEFTPEFLGLLARHCLNASFTTRVPVIFQDVEFNFKDISLFAQAYMNGNIKTMNTIQYQDEKNQLLVVDTPDQGQIISFVNGMNTTKGGVHVEAFIDKLITHVVEKVNSKEKKTKKINKADVKPHLSLFLSCSISKPEFDNQSKETLQKPKPKIPKESNLEEEGKKMLKWELVDRLKATLNSKNFRDLGKTDGKKKMFLSHVNLEDAKFAGSNRSNECTLFLCEGLSASTYVLKGTGNKRDIYGVFPLKGKPLNVTKSNDEKIYNNVEIQSLKTILGLKQNVDYSLPENRDTLRYNNICIAADADVDGTHIRWLLHNLFMEQFNSLLKSGFVRVLLTPIIKAKQGKQTRKFYTEKEFDNWLKQDVSNKTWKTKHMKGLATSEDQDIIEEFENPKIVSYTYDEYSEDYFNLAFGDYMEDFRKKWILNYDKNKDDSINTPGTLSYGINNELVLYSVYSVKTKLPSLIDGLKVCQRKILYGAIKKGRSQFIKVDQLASYVAEIASYHHGEDSLSEAIKIMSQEFIGSNNIPLLEGSGQFGSRKELGKDAGAGRYIFTRVSNIVQYLFRREDDVLLEYVEDENEKVEPRYYHPIIPVFAVNGAEGIASGFSSKIWNRNPKQIIEYIRNWIEQRENIKIKPYFKDYKGKIEKDDKGWYSEGSFHKKYSSVIIDELPVHVSFVNYEKKLENLKEKKTISDFKSSSTSLKIKNRIELQPSIDIRGCKNPSVKNLKLKKYLSETVVLLDENDRPIQYDTLEDAIEHFCKLRLQSYEKRKNKTIPLLENELLFNKRKLNFILDVLNNNLEIRQRDEQQLLAEMKRKNYDESFLQLSVRSLTRQRVSEQEQMIKEQEEKLNIYKNTPYSQLWIKELKELESFLV